MFEQRPSDCSGKVANSARPHLQLLTKSAASEPLDRRERQSGEDQDSSYVLQSCARDVS